MVFIIELHLQVRGLWHGYLCGPMAWWVVQKVQRFAAYVRGPPWFSVDPGFSLWQPWVHDFSNVFCLISHG